MHKSRIRHRQGALSRLLRFDRNRLVLKVQLQRQLDLARISGAPRPSSQNGIQRIRNLAERAIEARVSDSKRGVWIGEVWMIEGIEELSAELPLESLSHSEHLEQTEVRHLNSGSMEGARPARSERPVGWKCECRRIDEEACIGVARSITGRACERIANTVGIRGVI